MIYQRPVFIDEENRMLAMFNQWSTRRTLWFMLFLSGLAAEGCALALQYGFNIQPCVMCIYQRAWVLGIVVAGLIGTIAPSGRLRYVAIVLWLAAAAATLTLAWQHTMLQLRPPLFATCDYIARFPTWLPLDSWAPSVFVAKGVSCMDKGWTLASLSLPEWLVIASAIWLLLAIIVLLAQFKCPWRSKQKASR